VVDSCTERLEGRLHDYAKRSEVSQGFERIANTLADLKVELSDKLTGMSRDPAMVFSLLDGPGGGDVCGDGRAGPMDSFVR
jgi:hypothetical protein